MTDHSFSDSDQTVLRPGRVSPHALAPGTMLAEFEIRSVVGQGGFGIVYRAYDHSLGRDVAVKEYMPVSFAGRQDNTHVTILSEHYAEAFRVGLQSFVKEAQLLAKFDHPSLVKVYRFWEANGTGYMAMPFYDAPTLKQLLKLERTPFTEEAWLQKFLGQILDALQVLHDKRCYHRDIAPDNILMIEGRTPLLLDFGAARHVIGDVTQTLTVILKPGYAPIEQYGDMNHISHGPWTDLYALASVAYYIITESVPPAAMSRLLSDSMVPLAVSAKDRYSAPFLTALDAALNLRPEHRPQSVSQFRTMLGLEPVLDQGPVSMPFAPAPIVETPASVGRSAPVSIRPTQPIQGVPNADAESTIVPLARPIMQAPQADTEVASEVPPPSKARWPKVARMFGVFVVLCLIAAALFWPSPKPRPPAPVAIKELPKAAPPAAPMPAAAAPASCTLKFDDGSLACPAMVDIPEGSYRMGAMPGDTRAAGEEFGAVTGKIAAFSIAAQEVSVDQWQLCVADRACPPIKSQATAQGKLPVTQVSWDAAQQFVAWLSSKTGLSYRLPTEAEWEYAARAGASTAYPWGDAIGEDYAHCGQCGSHLPITGPAPVGSFKDHRGLYDMVGNVFEWVDDCWYGSHADAPSKRDQSESACRKKVQKGGAYDSVEADVRPSARTWDDRANSDVRVGFRVAR
ncbi:Formylglycine-generating enzyme, required for sulfatase activity, contains SUMF1/FGE domain [Duganella sp. CF458]|uniref:bifunctional serine/threonine-protein kinase/formylglycine-generating enzyme family protein n=1 Tax=Duganella sp. CF458 TaxID=1884368 RepID=UPI0008F24E22|nr:bifunctional serine/threonine-protein kinase/formylglycine-generating enzyme family protein [Duganella sp. CF458]SFG09239.1 Formylglycine-generating enzyme, required for sulfatase activity, contains SUMF1/FGE domain [Duganella sp. CF458]